MGIIAKLVASTSEDMRPEPSEQANQLHFTDKKQ